MSWRAPRDSLTLSAPPGRPHGPGKVAGWRILCAGVEGPAAAVTAADVHTLLSLDFKMRCNNLLLETLTVTL